MAANRATFMRGFRLSLSSLLSLALAVSTLSAISVVSPPSASALTDSNCTPTVSGLTASAKAVGNDCVITFTAGSAGTWTLPAGITSVRYLVVAGGGAGGAAGGNDGSGGGGAGGLLTGTFTPGATSYTITVGAGGASYSGNASNHDPANYNGGNSSISGTGLTTITSIGGGSGSSEASDNGKRQASAGGSGGGGGGYSGFPGAGTSGQGYIGGSTAAPGDGGGGGAGGPGGNGRTSNTVNSITTPMRQGGIGVTSDITGTTTYYAGGGGAAGDARNESTNGGAGGQGGGGNGANAASNSAPTNGTPNTGGGGGGAAGVNPVGSEKPTGAGGSGVVIVRFTVTTCSPSSTSSGGYTILTFTSTTTCKWSVPAGVTAADVLVVGGGGGGGRGTEVGNEGGGGGGGGVIETTGISLSEGSYLIAVGAGGAADQNGTGSSALGVSVSGGGKGGTANQPGGNGASGGGGTHNATNGGTGIAGQGFAGGKPSAGSRGGGGGGAGEAGNTNGEGHGGDGKVSAITGATYGGGGTGTNNSGALGGTGGGGVANASLNQTFSTDSNGSANTGGGGAGGFTNSGIENAGNGGSGVVVIRYIEAAFTITYAAGTGGSGSAPSSPTSVNNGATFTTPANTYSRAGYSFVGWFDGSTTYAASATYPTTGSVTANVTLTATWTANTLTITYDSQSGSAISSGSTTTGGSISTSPGTPTRNGYTFNGWFAASTGGTAIGFPYTHNQTANFTLYAQWSAISCADGGVCIVGDTGPGGGIVFYVAPSGGTFACGQSLSSTCKYLEAAPITGASPWTDNGYAWSGNLNTAIGSTSTAIGTGYSNTLKMVRQVGAGTAGAGSAARGYRGGSLNDWYLPSKDELNQLCKWARGFTASDLTDLTNICNSSGSLASGFAGGFWSSSEYNADGAWDQGFYDGSQGVAVPGKHQTTPVRPIRAFGSSAVESAIIYVPAIAGVTAPVSGATPVTTVTAANGYTGTVTWSSSPSTFAAATTYTATITLTASSGFTLTGVTANFFTVSGATSVTHLANSGSIAAEFPETAAAAQTITRTSTSPGSPVVAGTYTPTATASSGLTVAITIASGSSSICSISGGIVTFDAAGSCVIQYNQAGGGGYASASQVTETLTIGKGSQSITFGALSNRTLGSGTYSISATSSSSLTVAFTSATTSVCTVATTTITLVTAGTCTINANQSGDSNYLAATQVQRSFTIATALSITTPSGASLQGTYNTAFTSLTIASSGGAGTNSFSATGSLPTGVTLSSAGVISGTPSVAGDFSLTVTVTDVNGATATTNSFTISIAKGVSSVSISVPAYTFTGSPQGPDSVSTSGSTGAVTYAYVGRGSTTYASSSTKPTNVGTYTVTATVAADTNFASVSATADFQISDASLVITPTISASSMAYGTSGASLPTISHTKSPDISLTTNPTCSLYLASDTGFVTAQTLGATLAAGSYVARCTGAAATNYTITYGANPSFTVTKIDITLTVGTPASTPYTGSSVSVTNSFTRTTGTLAGSDAISGMTYTYTSAGGYNSTTAPTNGGIYTITGSSATFSTGSASNYTITYVAGSLTISAATQTVTWAPTTALLTTDSPATPSSLATALGSATISYAVTSAGTTGCTVNSSTAVLTFTADGSCQVTATAAATSNYATGSTVVTFVISLPTYVITLAAGTNGSGSNQTLTKTLGVTLTLPNSATANGYFTRTGYSVSGWSTTNLGSQTHALGGSFTTNADTTLYPVWTGNSLTITYDSQGGSAISNGSTTTGGSISASPGTPTRAGYTFAGWSATTTGSTVTFPYAHGVTMAITMYARWNALDNAVTFDSKSGSSVASAIFSSGGTVAEPTAPTRSGYTFAGWSATDGGSAVTFPYAPGVVTDITLYAKWTVVSQNNTGGSGGGSENPVPSISIPSEPVAPVVPVKSNVTIVPPITVIGATQIKVSIIDVGVTSTTPSFKPPVVKIDTESEKLVTQVIVVDGKLLFTPETGFSGKKTVTVTITENGTDRIVQIPLTVLPEAVTKAVFTPTAANRSIIRWTESPNADGYTIYLKDKKICSTTASSCSVKIILGPKAVVTLASNGADRTVSEKIDADYKQVAPIQITRLVSSTNIKSTLSSVDTKALDKVINLIKSQGFETVVISDITTTKKTEAAAAARIAAIKKYIDDKTSTTKIVFSVVPPTSRTYFNNISVKG